MPSLRKLSCKKQTCVALSTVEAEYIVAVSYCAQSLWLKQKLEDFGVILDHILLKCDNTSAINLSKNLVMHSRTIEEEVANVCLMEDSMGDSSTVEETKVKYEF